MSSTVSSCESTTIFPSISPPSTPVVSSAIHPPILDSGCSDTAYRLDDVALLPPPTPSPSPFCITCASGDKVCSVGSTTAPLDTSSSYPVHVFDNNDLALSLHSLADFANAGNTCLFTKEGFKITDPSGSIICENSKDPSARLWPMPILSSYCPDAPLHPMANLFIRNEFDAEYVQHTSSCFGNPPDSTLYLSCLKGWLGNFPRISPIMIHQNRPNSVETQLGHLNRLRQNLRSTSNRYSVLTVDDEDEDPLPDLCDPMSAVDLSDEATAASATPATPDGASDVYTKIVDLSTLSPEEIALFSLHSDATGRYPFESFNGNNYILVSVYLNYIHVEPMPDRSAASYVSAYRKSIDFFRSKGHVVSVQRLDNETSGELESFFRNEAELPFQYISANNKRANKAERAIASFKNHFIASYASVSVEFPPALWDELLWQIELTLNHLRPCTSNPSISAYEGILRAKFDFLANPIVPVGTKVLIFEAPNLRSTYSPHGVLGFYLRPEIKHYRNAWCYVPSSGGFRASDQCAFFPQKYMFPGASKEEILLKAISDLQAVISTSDLPDLPPAVDALKSAVVALDSPRPLTTPSTNPLQRVLDQRPPPVRSEHTVSSSEGGTPPMDSSDILRRPKRTQTKQPADPYRPLLPAERKQQRFRLYLSRVGQHFRDTETDEVLVIDSVVMPSKLKGPGSNTPFYKMFYTTQFFKPTASREFEYTSCVDILRAKYVEWIPRGKSPVAAAILSLKPPTMTRSLNQTPDGKPLNFKKSKDLDPDLWDRCDAEEWDRLFRSDTLLPIFHNQIPNTERGNVAYYNRQVKEKLKFVDDEEWIESRVRGTFGGNVYKYNGPVSANTAAYATVKLVFASVLSDVKNKNSKVRFVGADLVDHYLATPLEQPAYMCVPLSQIPLSIVLEYCLRDFSTNGKVCFKVMKCMYGHPAAGHLSNALLISTLRKGGYYEDEYTPCLFHHESRPTKFCLVVDDLGAKIHSDDDLDHLVNCISSVWKVKVDKSGSKFLGMNLAWDYEADVPSLAIDSPSTMPAAHKRFTPGRDIKHRNTPTVMKNPFAESVPIGSPLPDLVYCPESKTFVQEVCGTFQHYARVVDYSMLTAVSDISMSQANPTTETLDQVDRLLGYSLKYPCNKIVMYACDMQLRVVYDASYQSLSDGRSRVGHIQYLCNVDDPPETVKSIFHAASQVLRATPASVVEAEYGSAFEAGQATYPSINTLEALGHPQSPVQFFGDSEISVAIANDAVKVKRSRAIEKSYHWFRGKCRDNVFVSKHIPGSKNVSDYLTKDVSKQRHDELAPKLITLCPVSAKAVTISN